MKALALGHSTFDITLVTDFYPEENLKYRLGNNISCGGGPASNGGYLMAKWGLDTSIAGVVGNDYYGKLVKEDFKKVGANTKYLELVDGHSTDSSYIIANTSNGSRTILTSRDGMVFDSLNNNPNEKYDIILIDGEHYKSCEYVLKNNMNAISVLDAGRLNDKTRRLGRLVTYLVCSHDFAEEFSGISLEKKDIKKLKKVYEMLRDYFKTNIIITLEASGSFTKINNKYKIIPSIKVKAVDATGAGDIFHGAFAYFISNGYNLEDAIRLSSITGAISVTRIGSRNSIPTLKEVLEYDKSK